MSPGLDSRVLAVHELTARIKYLLETGFASLGVKGEISNLRRQASGHIYFTLKDDRSQLSAVLFRGNARQVALELEDGMEVVCYGNVSVYEPRGTYQLIVRDVEEAGQGRLQQAFETLKAKLADEGLFDEARKRALPGFPREIGVVTSSTGAAIRDFLRILQRRGYRGKIRIFPALVQGSTAAASLVQALEAAARCPDLDVVVIGRGGGSLEDLWAFNEEPLVRAVAAFPLPVISAVGHEIDFALTDFAADMRAETPSAAAELLSSLWLERVERFQRSAERLGEHVERGLQRKGQDLDYTMARLRGMSPELKLHRMRRRLGSLGERLGSGLSGVLKTRRETLGRLSRRLERHFPEHRLQLSRERLRSLEGRLRRAGVESTLKRGFALVRDDRGKPITAVQGLKEGQSLSVEFADGSIRTKIIDK